MATELVSANAKEPSCLATATLATFPRTEPERKRQLLRLRLLSQAPPRICLHLANLNAASLDRALEALEKRDSAPIEELVKK